MDSLNVIIVFDLTLLDVLLGLMGCCLAVVMGALLAKKQARAYSNTQGDAHPSVNYFDSVTCVSYIWAHPQFRAR